MFPQLLTSKKSNIQLTPSIFEHTDITLQNRELKFHYVFIESSGQEKTWETGIQLLQSSEKQEKYLQGTL